MKIHLFICNYNAATKLKQTLDSIYPPNPEDISQIPTINVAIVDNASKDNSKEIITNFGPSYSLFSPTNIGKAKALNQLVKEYSERNGGIEDDDLIISLDSDIYLTQFTFFDTLRVIWSILQDKVACLVCFQIGNSLFKRQFNWTQSKKGFSYFCPSEGYGSGVAGGAVIMPYKYWKAVKGYTEDRGIYGSNDGLLLLKLWNHTNKPICVVKELEVYHAHEDNMTYEAWKQIAQQEQLKHGKCLASKGFYD